MDAAGLSTFIARRVQLAYSNLDAEVGILEAFVDSLRDKYVLLLEFIQGKAHCLVCCVVGTEAVDISPNCKYGSCLCLDVAGFFPAVHFNFCILAVFVAGNQRAFALHFVPHLFQQLPSLDRSSYFFIVPKTALGPWCRSLTCSPLKPSTQAYRLMAARL